MRKRVLLDANLPHALRNHLAEYETVTAAYASLAGYRNGQLLKAAAEAGFEVLVTGDQSLQYEQNLAEQKIAVVCLAANAQQILKPHVDKVVEAVKVAYARIVHLGRGQCFFAEPACGTGLIFVWAKLFQRATAA